MREFEIMFNNPIVFSFLLFSIFIYSILFITIYLKKKEVKEKIEGLANGALEMTPEEFFKLRNASFGGRGKKHISSQYNFAGVYILYNVSKKMY